MKKISAQLPSDWENATISEKKISKISERKESACKSHEQKITVFKKKRISAQMAEMMAKVIENRICEYTQSNSHNRNAAGGVKQQKKKSWIENWGEFQIPFKRLVSPSCLRSLSVV